MSEIKLNLIDATRILTGTTHGSNGDYCVAALSAEPETITELIVALERFEKHPPNFESYFRTSCAPDEEPYDAGIMIIDLAGRIVARESTYSLPGPTGQVHYHNGQFRTEIPIFYSLPDDWLFLDSIEQYGCVCTEQRENRLKNQPLDARAVLYGRPLLEFLATNVRYASACRDEINENPDDVESILSPIGAIHAQWLLTPRDDLRGQSPREVLLAKQEFISSDLESRSFQWSMQLEGPPCLAQNSFAYRFAGFGFHEWVIYYELIRHLLRSTINATADQDFEDLITQLESLKNSWLNEPSLKLEGRIPAIIIDNERRRLPEAMGGRSMVVDEDCPVCKMMGDECEMGLEVCFWHLDGCNMEEHFAFSTFATEQEYLEDRIKFELHHREWQKEWKEREARIASGELVEAEPLFDPLPFDELVPFALAEPEPPEA